MKDPKQHCEEGESEAHIALGGAMLACVVLVPVWVLFLWAIGLLNL